MLVTLETRKPVESLTPDDFAAFPIWQYADDEEGIEGRDETWVRPIPSKVVAEHIYVHAAAVFTAACGRTFSGYVTVSTLEGPPEVSQGSVFQGGKSLFVSNPEAFHFEESREALLAALDLTEADVFPLAWRLLVPVEGKSGPIQGVLP
jgi:hypothetical protein